MFAAYLLYHKMILDFILTKKLPSNSEPKAPTDLISRSLLKALSWRILGSLDTILICYIITGTLSQALSIGFIEWGTKVVLYFFHERLWNYSKWGKK